MQDLIEAAKNDDITTVEHILQKGEAVSRIIDARESDKVNLEDWEPLWLNEGNYPYVIDFQDSEIILFV